MAAVIAILIGAVLWGIFGRINTYVNVAVVSSSAEQTCYVPYEKLESVISASNTAGQKPASENTSAEKGDTIATASQPVMPSSLSIFAIVTVMFTILSVSINVMQFAGGLSQIRPVNAIPAPVGLVFGSVGAVACALGNLLGDLPNLDLYGGTINIGVRPL